MVVVVVAVVVGGSTSGSQKIARASVVVGAWVVAVVQAKVELQSDSSTLNSNNNKW